jgi:Cu(I)/Ag(I) efflux system membrane fusion protein
VTLVPPALEVLANVGEDDLGRIAVGQIVHVEVAAFPTQSFNARIDSISPTVDARSRLSAVHIQPEDPDGVLRAGMFAQVSISTASKNNALLVPTSALLTMAEQPAVVAIDSNNTARVQPVQLGLQNDATAEILSGVDEGDLVAISGIDKLHDGDLVAPQFAIAADVVRQ